MQNGFDNLTTGPFGYLHSGLFLFHLLHVELVLEDEDEDSDDERNQDDSNAEDYDNRLVGSD